MADQSAPVEQGEDPRARFECGEGGLGFDCAEEKEIFVVSFSPRRRYFEFYLLVCLWANGEKR